MELTTQPLSIRTARTPRFLSSMPQARPVGPAPTMTTSKLSTTTFLPRRNTLVQVLYPVMKDPCLPPPPCPDVLRPYRPQLYRRYRQASRHALFHRHPWSRPQ